MVKSVTPQDSAARTPVGDLRKRTDRELTDMWCEMTLAIDGLSAPRKEIGEILRERAVKTGKRFYKASQAVEAKGIAVERSGGSLVLDQEAVRAYLGEKLSAFQKRSKLGWTLKLLQ